MLTGIAFHNAVEPTYNIYPKRRFTNKDVSVYKNCFISKKIGKNIIINIEDVIPVNIEDLVCAFHTKYRVLYSPEQIKKMIDIYKI
jgi:DNA-directed RNA polymerase subunit F